MGSKHRRGSVQYYSQFGTNQVPDRAFISQRPAHSVAAIELKVPDAGYLSSLRSRLYEFYLSRGVLLRPLGNVVYILPPYVISPDQLNFLYDVIQDSLALVSKTA